MVEVEPKKEEPKKEKPRIVLSELDTTMIKLHELFQNNDVMVALNLKLNEKDGNLIRSFQILDCAVLTNNEVTQFKKPEYFG